MAGGGFRGGVHPRTDKERTAARPIEPAPRPAQVIIPLAQSLGAPAKPLVAAGDRVKAGQVIGEAQGFVSVPVHASVSGTVKAVGEAPSGLAVTAPAVTIAVDAEDEWVELHPAGALEELTPEAIRAAALAAGLVGLGGATFPAHVKLSPPADKPIDLVIINGCECEPCLTSDHRLMVERPGEVLQGLLAIRKAVGANRAVVAVEDNKPDAVQALSCAARQLGRDIEVMALPTKYPQGAEKQLIFAVSGRKVPPGRLPLEVGVVVHNAGTAVALAEALATGRPLVERVVTVTGSLVREPKNLLVRLGTPVSALLDHCGLTGEPAKLVLGGPMMGLAQASLDVPVTKGTSGILVLSAEEAQTPPAAPCIRCGRCAQVCPMNLLPLYLAKYAERGLWAEAEGAGAVDCIECGSCSYSCPAKRPLVQQIRLAKQTILAGPPPT
ncbi:MAG: electron transport complex subunit RsxC, partial [Chitinophagales bacterium]